MEYQETIKGIQQTPKKIKFLIERHKHIVRSLHEERAMAEHNVFVMLMDRDDIDIIRACFMDVDIIINLGLMYGITTSAQHKMIYKNAMRLTTLSLDDVDQILLIFDDQIESLIRYFNLPF